jgi:hypothetical protein
MQKRYEGKETMASALGTTRREKKRRKKQTNENHMVDVLGRIS